MSGYDTTSEAVYKALCEDELLLDLLEFVEPIDDETPEYRIYNGWPEGDEIELTADRPAYLIITSESDKTSFIYDRSELFQVRVVANGRDLCEDLKNRIFDLIDTDFTQIDESKYSTTNGSGRVQLSGGQPSSGALLFDSDGGYWAVNVRFQVETVKKG